MENEIITDSSEFIEDDIERVLRVTNSSTNRWIRIDNRFWRRFDKFIEKVVIPSIKSNPYRFAPCCWCFLKRKKEDI